MVPWDSLLLLSMTFSGFFHAVAYTSALFLFITKSYSTVWLDHSLSIWSSVVGHLSRFCFSALMYNAALNSYVHIFVGTCFYLLFSISLGVELLAHMVTLSLTSWETARLFSHFHQQWTKFQIFLLPHQHSLSTPLLIAILWSATWCLCFSLSLWF